MKCVIKNKDCRFLNKFTNECQYIHICKNKQNEINETSTNHIRQSKKVNKLS